MWQGWWSGFAAPACSEIGDPAIWLEHQIISLHHYVYLEDFYINLHPHHHVYLEDVYINLHPRCTYMWPGSIWCPSHWNAAQEHQDSICAVLTFPVDILPIKVIPMLSIWDFLWPTPIWLLWVVALGETWQIKGTMSFIAPLRILTLRIAFGEIFFAGQKKIVGFYDCRALECWITEMLKSCWFKVTFFMFNWTITTFGAVWQLVKVDKILDWMLRCCWRGQHWKLDRQGLHCQSITIWNELCAGKL